MNFQSMEIVPNTLDTADLSYDPYIPIYFDLWICTVFDNYIIFDNNISIAVQHRKLILMLQDFHLITKSLISIDVHWWCTFSKIIFLKYSLKFIILLLCLTLLSPASRIF